MKFTWGTGIFIFLVLFLAAAGVFIAFAMRQDVNLVHEDYYERGVDHSHQMEVDARSASYGDSLHVASDEKQLSIWVVPSLALRMDSARIQLYRPSGSAHDLELEFRAMDNPLLVPRSALIPGRYILKMNWVSDGQDYEVHKDVYL